MLQLRPNCECCDRDLPPAAAAAGREAREVSGVSRARAQAGEMPLSADIEKNLPRGAVLVRG